MLDLNIRGFAANISADTLGNFVLCVEQYHFKELAIRTQESFWKNTLAKSNYCSLHLKLFPFKNFCSMQVQGFIKLSIVKRNRVENGNIPQVHRKLRKIHFSVLVQI